MATDTRVAGSVMKAKPLGTLQYLDKHLCKLDPAVELAFLKLQPSALLKQFVAVLQLFLCSEPVVYCLEHLLSIIGLTTLEIGA